MISHRRTVDTLIQCTAHGDAAVPATTRVISTRSRLLRSSQHVHIAHLRLGPLGPWPRHMPTDEAHTCTMKLARSASKRLAHRSRSIAGMAVERSSQRLSVALDCNLEYDPALRVPLPRSLRISRDSSSGAARSSISLMRRRAACSFLRCWLSAAYAPAAMFASAGSSSDAHASVGVRSTICDGLARAPRRGMARASAPAARTPHSGAQRALCVAGRGLSPSVGSDWDLLRAKEPLESRVPQVARQQRILRLGQLRAVEALCALLVEELEL